MCRYLCAAILPAVTVCGLVTNVDWCYRVMASKLYRKLTLVACESGIVYTVLILLFILTQIYFYYLFIHAFLFIQFRDKPQYISKQARIWSVTVLILDHRIINTAAQNCTVFYTSSIIPISWYILRANPEILILCCFVNNAVHFY